MIDWGEIRLPQEAMETTWLMPWKMQLNDRAIFMKEKIFCYERDFVLCRKSLMVILRGRVNRRGVL